MRLTTQAQDGWLTDLAQRFDGGTLRLLEAGTLGVVLVEIPFDSPAFEPAISGKALARALPATVVTATGDVARAQVVSASGDAIADLVVRLLGALDEFEGDLILDRLDVQRGGICEIQSLVLRLPRQP